MHAKVVRFLCDFNIAFNVLHSTYYHDFVNAINEAPKVYNSPNYEKARTLSLDREKAKIHKTLTQFIDKWADCGISIILYGRKNVRNQHLINFLGFSSTGTILITCHYSSSISATSKTLHISYCNQSEMLFLIMWFK